MAGSNTSEIPVYSRLPISIERGEGCTVWDANGKSYLDLYGGHAVAALGYAHPIVTTAIQDQVQRLIFQTNAVELGVREAAIARLAKASIIPDSQIFLVNSGTEANENALRLAFLTTNRSRIVAVRGSFHGRTGASAAVTDGSEKWYGFPRQPFEVSWVDRTDPNTLRENLTEDVAAFIVEPVQGVAGAVALELEFLQMARELTSQNGIAMIADEVQCGVGRTGTMWSIEQAHVVPDFITCAKGLGNGYPVGAVLGSPNWTKVAKVGTLGTTFGGGPVAAAAMDAVLSVIDDEAFLSDVRERAEFLRASIEAFAPTSGKGFLLGVRCPKPAQEIRLQLLERGYITGDAKDPSVLRLLPPLILSRPEISEFVNVLREVLQ